MQNVNLPHPRITKRVIEALKLKIELVDTTKEEVGQSFIVSTPGRYRSNDADKTADEILETLEQFENNIKLFELLLK